MARGGTRLGVQIAPDLSSQNETQQVAYYGLLLVLLICAVTLPSQVHAAIRRQSIGEELDLTAIKKVESLNTFSTEDVQEVIPTDLTPTSDPSTVGVQIMDHSINNFLNSPIIKNSSFGKTAAAVEKKMSADMSIGGGAPVEEGEKPPVEHKINFNMQPTQARAQMKYTGLLNADLNYKLNNQEVSLEMTRQVYETTQVVMNSSSSPAMGTLNKLSLRWDWF